MSFQKSQPAETGRQCPLGLRGPTEIFICIIPRTKSARARNIRKNWALHKAGVGDKLLLCSALNYPDARHHHFCQL
jgi:hypothetical protein